MEIVLVEQWDTPDAVFHAIATVETSAPRSTVCGHTLAATAPEMRRDLAETRATACPSCFSPAAGAPGRQR